MRPLEAVTIMTLGEGLLVTKRIDYSKANRERKMRTQGVEGLEDLGTAEQAREDYRDGVKERGEKWVRRGASHNRIKEQASADFEAKRAGAWDIIRGSTQPKERTARKPEKQGRRGTKTAK
jgi:hypothetical protein